MPLDRWASKIFGIATVLVFAIIVGGALWGVIGKFLRSSQVDQVNQSGVSGFEDVARAFVDDVHAGQWDDVYGRMAASFREQIPIARFRAAVSVHPYLKDVSEPVSFFSTESLRDATEATGTLQRSTGNVSMTFSFTKEGDGPRITGIILGGIPVFGP